MNSAGQPHQIFNDSWTLYKKIVQGDYMHHKLFNRLALDVLEEFKQGPDIQMLDIGSGDAEPIIPLIKNLPITRYTGIDLSDVVLEKCAVTLGTLNIEFKLKQGDMEVVINQEEGPFDLIHSSYAIHHLSDRGKPSLLKKISSLLRPGGVFIYIDIIREEGQSLEQYRKDYNEYIENWIGITPMEKLVVTDHIKQFDFPATRSDTENWIAEAFLKELKYYKADKRHMFLALKKN